MSSKKSFKKSRPTAKKNAKKIRVLMKRPEVKFSIPGSSVQSRAGAAHYFALNNLTQGLTNNNRIGDTVEALSINLRVQFGLPVQDLIGTDTTVNGWTLSFFDTRVRILLFIDVKNDNHSAVTEGEVFNNVASPIENINSQLNRDFVGKGKKYKILYDKYHYVSTQDSSKQQLIVINRKLNNMKVTYTGNAGTAADILDRKIMLGFITESDCDMGFRGLYNYRDS